MTFPGPWFAAETEFASSFGEIGRFVAGGGSVTHGERAVDPGIGEVAGGGGDHGKTARALGSDLREHGYVGAADEALSVAFTELRAAGVTTKSACALIGRPRATHYRQLLGPVLGPKPRRNVPDNGQALTPAERDAVLALINAEGYADLSIGQIWTRELDEGRYLCSMSTMYRLSLIHI